MIDGISCGGANEPSIKQAIPEPIQKPPEAEVAQAQPEQDPGPAIASSMHILDILA